MFDFKHIKPFERSLVDAPGAMVLFATPGMLHAGLSLEVFKKWAPNELSIHLSPSFSTSFPLSSSQLVKKCLTPRIHDYHTWLLRGGNGREQTADGSKPDGGDRQEDYFGGQVQNSQSLFQRACRC